MISGWVSLKSVARGAARRAAALTPAALAVAAVAGVAGVMVGAGPAWADARTESVRGRGRPEFEPLGLPLDLLFWEAGRLFTGEARPPREGGAAIGSFNVFPSLEVSAEFSDNVFLDDTNESSDLILRAVPVIEVASDWDNHNLTLTAGVEIGKFVDLTDEDYVDLLAEARGGIDVTEDVRTFHLLRWRRGHEQRGAPEDPGSNFDVTIFRRVDFDNAVIYESPLAQINLGYNFTWLDYDDVTGPGGTVNNDDRDRNDNRVSARVGREVTQFLFGYVEGAYNWSQYDSSPDDAGLFRDNNGYEALAGVEWDPSDVWAVRVDAGFQNQNFDDPSFGSLSDFIFAGDVLWNATDLLTFRAGANRSIDQTTFSNASGIVATSAFAQADYEVLYNLLVGARGAYALQDYGNISREDNRYKFNIYGDYFIGENAILGAEYNLDVRNSNTAGNDYTANSFLLRAQLQL